MKIEKNKIVFAAVLATVLIFIIAYSVMIMSDDEVNNENLEQTLVPELKQEQKEYSSKLDAINQLKEVKQTNAPSIYDEKLIDSLGYFDADLPEKEKERIVDSIYKSGRITYTENRNRQLGQEKNTPLAQPMSDSIDRKNELKIESKEMGLEHQLFFASSPNPNELEEYDKPENRILAVVDGDQTVQVNDRLRMRLIEDALINNVIVAKNSPIYGFISFQPNRALIEIENIDHHPTKLKAFDLQDGSEGIYVENSFRAEATNEVVDDIIQDINIPSVPQVSGITKVLRRSNRNIKVTIVNNYKLILKAPKGH